MKKLTRLNFVKENSEFINQVFKEVMEFIESSNEIIIRSDEESFRIDLINYLYDIYINGQ